MKKLRCIFGIHHYKMIYFWIDCRLKLTVLNHPLFKELLVDLRKERIKENIYPCFKEKCIDCGYEKKGMIDTLYPATKPFYPPIPNY